MISTSNYRVTLVALLLLGACATSVVQRAPESATAQPAAVANQVAGHAADNALAMLGKPYRHSGNTPAGFDCSGLVQYSYSKVGVNLPRATQAQRREGQSVSASELRRGDLVFFDQEGKKSSHVGIYVGQGRFVHAPSTGGRVRTDGLDATYWRTHFVEARRL
jgi:cell wall-associated NlpC family hydrolase